jgi:hypothetical protein
MTWILTILINDMREKHLPSESARAKTTAVQSFAHLKQKRDESPPAHSLSFFTCARGLRSRYYFYYKNGRYQPPAAKVLMEQKKLAAAPMCVWCWKLNFMAFPRSAV